ncbi:glyoxalase/bleomycin resistance/extradiol dioxygenase family protein [Heliobacterium gestii]|uniref:Glyoxalase/bleomycin resistance/extradiol dioxygenase family protein n=1 Tax=Heliomicrobium gestii TaxID=2699 RepID=A0A845LJQ1_HELGE|nr:VOC family protein [Heliomicrobium gestii]MBM7868442.1 lactoylglutathione lyase [Heliomicrobium gestii]MZP44615.1 glyoxalase/bleomycin resistance/extradiol dioxygenase family protein [Heliomicrobium gestii]
MKIHHVAIWTNKLEEMRDFYCLYFGGTAGAKYRNERKQFESYFLSFDAGATLELMGVPELGSVGEAAGPPIAGLAHVAFATGARSTVDQLTERLRSDGYRVISEPRVTGDGYYESCVLDPDGNRVEITE